MTTPFDARRRALLRRGAGLLGALGLGAGGLTLAPRGARAGDYRALVCVFLYGGNDGANTLVPTERDPHALYAGLRGALALPPGSLVPLAGSGLGLHPSLAALQPWWDAGRLAPVLNVGPLVKPLTQSTFMAAAPADTTQLPESLFSHPDQRVLWEAGGGNPRLRSGWGGRAAGSQPVIGFGNNPLFGQAEDRATLVLPGPGELFGGYGLQAEDARWAPLAARQQALLAMYQDTQDNELAQRFAAQQIEAFWLSSQLAGLVRTLPGEAAAFALIDQVFAPLLSNGRFANPLAAQLYQVAKLIHARATLGGDRQIFLTQLEGFDTHANQVARDGATVGDHAQLLRWVGEALAAFHAALQAVGAGNTTVSFTQSEFGRTVLPNASLGTDHGWGNHHWVMGGPVRGGQVYGRLPDPTPGGADDASRHEGERHGRWIPQIAVDQYAATLLSWLGVGDAALARALPGLSGLGQRPLGFL